MIKLIILGAVIILVAAAFLSGENNKPDDSPKEWVETDQRKKNSEKAANEMNEHKMQNNIKQVVTIKQIAVQNRININLSALNTAQEKTMRICSHAERIRKEVLSHRNNPAYLKKLYCTGVGISNEAYALRKEVKVLNDAVFAMSKTNPAHRPLASQLNKFYKDVYNNEVELNNRNRILRNYIGSSFGKAEWKWNHDIETKAKSKRNNKIQTKATEKYR